jgi:hypothetical protein
MCKPQKAFAASNGFAIRSDCGQFGEARPSEARVLLPQTPGIKGSIRSNDPMIDHGPPRTARTERPMPPVMASTLPSSKSTNQARWVGMVGAGDADR